MTEHMAAHDAWSQARAAYLAAKCAEDTYDRLIAVPACRAANGTGSKVDAYIAESDRLCDLRSDAEDVLMSIPSPDPVAFAFKYLIAKGDNRETNHWDAMLEAEARMFAADFPPAWSVEVSHG